MKIAHWTSCHVRGGGNFDGSVRRRRITRSRLGLDIAGSDLTSVCGYGN